VKGEIILKRMDMFKESLGITESEELMSTMYLLPLALSINPISYPIIDSAYDKYNLSVEDQINLFDKYKVMLTGKMGEYFRKAFALLVYEANTFTKSEIMFPIAGKSYKRAHTYVKANNVCSLERYMDLLKDKDGFSFVEVQLESAVMVFLAGCLGKPVDTESQSWDMFSSWSSKMAEQIIGFATLVEGSDDTVKQIMEVYWPFKSKQVSVLNYIDFLHKIATEKDKVIKFTSKFENSDIDRIILSSPSVIYSPTWENISEVEARHMAMLRFSGLMHNFLYANKTVSKFDIEKYTTLSLVAKKSRLKPIDIVDHIFLGMGLNSLAEDYKFLLDQKMSVETKSTSEIDKRSDARDSIENLQMLERQYKDLLESSAKKDLRATEISLAQERKIASLEKELSEREEHAKEVASLRSTIYNLTVQEQPLAEIPIDNIIEEINRHRVVIVGGHLNWVNKMKAVLPKVTFFEFVHEGNRTLESLYKADLVAMYSGAIYHKHSRRVVNAVEKSKAKLDYFTNAVNIEISLRQIYAMLSKDN
jgi:hypothetical protein